MKYDKDFEKFYNKFKDQFPHLTNEQFQAVMAYAQVKLTEEKKRKLGQGKPESIEFNPVDASNPTANSKGAPSDAARTFNQYKINNVKGK